MYSGKKRALVVLKLHPMDCSSFDLFVVGSTVLDCEVGAGLGRVEFKAKPNMRLITSTNNAFSKVPDAVVENMRQRADSAA
jgi:hypothetical protein